jgi:hypothetical protein
MGGIFGSTAADFFASVLDQIMKGIWAASLAVLHAVFSLIDGLTGFSLTFDAGGNPVDPSIAASWGVLRTLSVTIALGLFFWQLISTMLHGGRGFFRAATGPFAYGIALSATGGVVAVLLAGADELTRVLLAQGFHGTTSFAGLLDNPQFGGLFTVQGQGQAVLNGVSTVALGVIAIFGVLPAALGYLLEMVFREAAILVLVSTIPITAAGLVAQTTTSWFWRSLRWILAAVVMKPALALVLVIGVSLLANPQGLAGVLAGVGVLLISLLCPYTLFRLFAFVDPGTNAGAASRAWASSFTSSSSPAGGGGGQVNISSGTDSAEAANTARFDQAGAGSGGSGSGGAGFGAMAGAVGGAAAWSTNFAAGQMDATGVGSPGGGRMSAGGAGGGSGSSSDGSTTPESGSSPDGDPGEVTDVAAPRPGEPPLARGGEGGGPGAGAGDDPPPPEQPPGRDDGPHDGGGGGGGGPRPGGGGGGRGGPNPGGGAGGVSAGEVGEAAVVL